MESGNVFKYTIAISIAVHGVVFIKSPNFSVNPVKITEPRVELNYLKDLKPPLKREKIDPPKKDPFLELPSRIVVNDRIPPPFTDTENSPKMPRSEPMQRGRLLQGADFIKPRTAALKNNISLFSPDINISKNPAYIGYYQISREKIKRAAYQQNYTGREEGEVTVSFVIASDGTLRQVRLVEQGSCGSPYLRDIAVAAVKEAAPFPRFPKELDYPQIPFTLTITFQH